MLKAEIEIEEKKILKKALFSCYPAPLTCFRARRFFLVVAIIKRRKNGGRNSGRDKGKEGEREKSEKL